MIVKGKTEPVGVYEILDYHTDDTFPNLMDGGERLPRRASSATAAATGTGPGRRSSKR